MPENNEVPMHAPLSQGLDGRTRVRALLMGKGLTIAGWFRAREQELTALGINHVQQVNMMLAGDRPYAEIRDLMAADLEMTREQFDALIPMPAAGPDAAKVA